MTAARVDAHHHVWDVSRRDYPWMDGAWADPIRQIASYVHRLVDLFGPDRLLFGSDWPVCLLAAGYGRVVELAERTLAGLPGEAVFGGNARRVYRLPGPPP